MKYCQECGSEIAGTVTFCPYCGISQKPVQGTEEIEQDKTIAVNQWELAALVGKEIETVPKDLSIKKPDILPEPKLQLPERQEISEKFEPPQNVTAENWTPKTDSIDIPTQIIPDTDASLQIDPSTDSSLKLPPDKELDENVPNRLLNTGLEVFDEKAEMVLKSQIELQRMIFVQNERIIELLEQLLKKEL